MFTGIIEEIGNISSVRQAAQGIALEISARKVLTGLQNGDSVNTDGVCLTVIHVNQGSFTVEVMAETLRRTSLGLLKPGSKVNLERALQFNGRLGGHLVSGHIDGTGSIAGMRREGIATWVAIEAGKEIMKYIIPKGSVAIDGISLTVVNVSGQGFDVSLIPHTSGQTTLLNKKSGDPVNIENDLVARYIEHFVHMGNQPYRQIVDMGFLKEHGFIE